MKVIETIINTPKVLTSNDAAITYDGTSVRTRCAYCSNGGWLDYQNGSPLFKIFGNGYTGYYDVNWSGSISSATVGTIAIGLYEDRSAYPRHSQSSNNSGC